MQTTLLYVLGILVIALGLAISIALHEVGHLLPAKRFGVRVSQYMIGFGPTIWSRRRGETEYGLKAMPLGGYISMSGMYPPIKPGGRARTASTGFFNTMVQDARSASAETIPEGEADRAFYALPVGKRLVIMAGGPLMNLLIGVVLYAILLMGFGIQQPSTTIAEVSACVLPAGSEQTECLPTDPEAPGKAAGLRPGDTILSWDGTAVTDWDQVTGLIRGSAGRTAVVEVRRGTEAVVLTLTPLLSERYVYDESGKPILGADGEPETVAVGFIGVGPAYQSVRQSPASVLPAVGSNIASVVGVIVHLPERLVDVWNAAFGPAERDPNGPISVVGVGRVAGEIASIDTVAVVDRVATLIGLLASLNIALFVFNLIPLMPLDGGHMAGALWEGIRRVLAKILRRPDPGPIDTARLVPLTLGVVAVLGAMSVLLIYADIVKPISLFG